MRYIVIRTQRSSLSELLFQMNYLLLLFILPLTHGLIGYDCGGGALNITTLNLLETTECDIDEVKTSVENTYIQLLQLSEFKKTKVMQCRVEIDRTVYHCGMHSHISITDHGRYSYIKEISREACHKLHVEGILGIGNNKYLTEIRANDTTHHSVILAGNLGHDGSCEGEFYSDRYGQWKNVVVQAIVKISLHIREATVKLESNKIIFKNGEYCRFSDTNCFNEEGGYSFWEQIPSDNCKFDAYDVLYEGFVSKIKDPQSEVSTPPVVYSISSNDVTFALIKTTEIEICGYTIYKTEHPKLFIFETTRGNTFKQKSKIAVENVDIFSYINSKFIYVEKHIKNQLNLLYRDIIKQKCELEKQVIKNALTIASLSPDEFAYNLMHGPGYMAIIAGEVVHIVKCIPVECTLRRTELCFSELPVSVRNASLFITPKSKILVKTASERECDPILATTYKIDETWYKFTPKPTEIIPPKPIHPSTKISWKYINPNSLGTSGIYGQQDLEELRDHFMFPAERPAVLNNIARGATGRVLTGDGISLYNLLDEDTLHKIAESTGKRIWNGFIVFGSATAGVAGVLISIRMVKLIIDTVIHGYTLHQIYGWSIKLIGALWSSVTHLLIYLGHKPDGEEKEVQEIRPTAPREHRIPTTEELQIPTMEELQLRLKQRQMSSMARTFENGGGGVTSPHFSPLS